MNVDDTDLLAYVDGHLPPARRAEVEEAVARSRELAARLDAMRRSALPYAAAFSRQELPPIPPALVKRVAELAVDRGAARGAADHGWRWSRLAAAFLLGLLLSAGAMRFWQAGDSANALARMADPWVSAVVAYQEMYTRETLVNVTEDRALSEKVVTAEKRSGLNVRVPDLQGVGLEFKRVQHLSFHDQPVVQIVYLPDQGAPVALCVTRDSRADEEPRLQKIGEMHTVAWRRDRLAYVLLAKNPTVDLTELGLEISRGQTPILYGSDSDGEKPSFDLPNSTGLPG